MEQIYERLLVADYGRVGMLAYSSRSSMARGGN